MTEHLPWESAEGPKYYAKELKPRKKWVTAGGWILSFVLILAGLGTKYRLLALFGLLYILTLLMQKTVAVTSRGLEIFYQMRITTHYDFWSWNRIESVLREKKDYPGELTALYFTSDIHTKRLFFTREDAKKVMALAEASGNKVFVGDGVPQKNNQTAKGPSQKKKK